MGLSLAKIGLLQYIVTAQLFWVKFVVAIVIVSVYLLLVGIIGVF